MTAEREIVRGGGCDKRVRVTKDTDVYRGDSARPEGARHAG